MHLAVDTIIQQLTMAIHCLLNLVRRNQRTTKRRSFYDLPPEIRNAIYEYALLPGDGIISITNGKDLHKRTALLRTTSLIRREASEMFYTRAIFTATTTKYRWYIIVPERRERVLQWLVSVGESATKISKLFIDVSQHETVCDECIPALLADLIDLGLNPAAFKAFTEHKMWTYRAGMTAADVLPGDKLHLGVPSHCALKDIQPRRLVAALYHRLEACHHAIIAWLKARGY
jgi:hypothetical protein